ncbi:MAG: T9SS type A sorting domain-containing protein [Flavobacteriales bacterium]|jgi:uncharacterized repeat protein (TIGR01451 family)|nr:T9SS type A sorting domain-containing protein [Flavobacteriales bacterium]
MNTLRFPLLAVTAYFTFAAQALTVTISKYQDSPCGQPLGVLDAYASGGVGPYTFSWSNGATTGHLEGLLPGSYTVTVTDGNSEQAAATETILDLPSHPFPVSGATFSHCPGGDPIAEIHFDQSGWTHGPGPHTITNPSNWVPLLGQGGAFTFYYMVFPGAAPGSTQEVQWADANGCPGTTSGQVSNIYQPPQMTSLTSTGACLGNNGSITGTLVNQQFAMVGVHLRTMDGTPIASGQNFTSDIGPYAFSFSFLAPGAYWVITDPDGLDSWDPGNPYGLPNCADSFYVEVPDLTGNCGIVQGRVYFDHDQDCVQDANEVGVPDRLITFTPGPEYAYTNSNGGYTRRLTNGSYTMAVDGTGTDLYPICPPTPTTDVVVSGGVVNQSFADSSLVPLDLKAEIAMGPARPGFVQNVLLRAKNLSGQLSGAVDLALTIDPQFSFLSAEPAPTSVVGNTVTWAGMDPLSGYQRHLVHVQVQVPPDIGLLNQPYAHTASVSQPLTESTLANNTANGDGTVQGSYDPNDKTARTSTRQSETEYFIGQDTWIDYTIRFQNTGTDTAFTVVVRDTLSEALDIGSFEMGIASHDPIITFLPNHVVEWRFPNILLPDSNVNEPGSHGLIDFRIKPMEPVLPGTVIENTANIYFDFNPPVITEPSVLVAEFSTGVATVDSGALLLAPIPANDQLLVSSSRSIDAVQVFAMDGREELRLSIRSTSATLNVGRLSSGAYLLVAHLENGTVLRQRFLKH